MLRKNIIYAFSITPKVGLQWLQMDDSQRLSLIHAFMLNEGAIFNSKLKVLSARDDGKLTFEFLNPEPVVTRSALLLDLEQLIKSKIDPALTVWIAPMGDKSSLRNLRGIKVKL